MWLRSSLLLAWLAAVLLLTGCPHRAAPPPLLIGGTLHGNQVWSGEVRIAGDVTLADDAVLTILPGTVIRFLPVEPASAGERDHPHFPGSELNVVGSVLAVGTVAEPIIFAAADDTAPPGSWGAVNFAEGSQGVFRRCVFRQADSAIHSREATVEVTESLFEHNLVAVRFHSSRMRIEHNLLRSNDTGIRFHFGAPVVVRNRFTGNRTNLFITAHPRDYHIEDNSFGTPLDYHVILGEEVPEPVLLGGNDWDGAAEQAVLDRIFDGRRSPYLGRVEVAPLRPLTAGEAGPLWIR